MQPLALCRQTLNIALPKGRLGDKVYSLLANIGYDCPEFSQNSRKLILENEQNGVRYFLVKPSDVAIYVERGAADVGVVGKDVLIEFEPDVYELLDLQIGKCRVAVAGPEVYEKSAGASLRIATKYPNIARKYYASRHRGIEVIKLNGSIELAPLVGLSDLIVDIVETGGTLRDNNLRVLHEIMDISARLIANKSSYKFKGAEIDRMADKLKGALEK